MTAHLTRSSCEGFSEMYINAVDETDDDLLWKISEKDGNVRSECKKDEGTDCEDGDGDTGW